MRRFLLCFLLFVSLLAFSSACAQTYTAVLPVSGGTVEVYSKEIDGEPWLFFPAFADLSALNIRELDSEYSLEPVEDEEGVWLLSADNAEIFVMQSQNLRTLFLFSDDPVNQGRSFIDQGQLRMTEATGSMALIAENTHVDYAGRLKHIRGRGNSTWGFEKKPYQIKLEDRFDLLNTGISSERNRTWILLAEALDPTLLQNRVSLDLAKEMGLSETAHCEHVDLYYDGEYRGTYLLTEKVEIGAGRVEEMDYGKLIEKWNRWIGQHDLAALPKATGQNAKGDPIYYVEGIADNTVCNAGAYLVEMYTRGTINRASAFVLENNWGFEVVNPKYASKDMVCYVSELLSDGYAALRNHGIHPDTGESVEKWFDLESFVPVVLLYELTHNLDAFTRSSSYFVLPAGETRFIAGPVWDFDRSLRNPEYRAEAGYTWGLKDGMSRDFFGVPAFLKAAQRFYQDQLYPLTTEILLGNGYGRYLRPLNEYAQEIRMSALMNQRLWPKQNKDRSLHYADSFDTNVEYLRRFIEQQNEWLYQTIVHNGKVDADHINITMAAEWLYPEEPLEFLVFPWSRVTVQSYEHTQLTEATEEDYALWHVQLVLAPQEGYAFENPQVWINNGRFTGTLHQDGTLLVEFQFEDLSYRPVDYYGDDIGMIFNPDFYAFNYPEVAKACEWDSEALMDYFCDEGMYEAHVGNGFFDPQNILFFHPRLADTLGEDWSLYYWDFLYYGYEEEAWLAPMDLQFVPPVSSYDDASH